MDFFKLKEEYSRLLFNKVEFINKIHERTGMSIILATELFVIVFKNKSTFSFTDLSDIINTYPSSLLYINKVNYILDYCD